MVYKKIASMEPAELESAIAWGIFKGGASLGILFFSLWILMPFILPLAIILGEVVTIRVLEPFANYLSAIPANEWKKMFDYLFITVGVGVGVTVAVGSLRESIWFEEVKKWVASKRERSGISMTRWAGVGLPVGFISFLLFVFFSLASLDMSRKFVIDDLIFLLGLMVVSVVSFYFSFKKSKDINLDSKISSEV